MEHRWPKKRDDTDIVRVVKGILYEDIVSETEKREKAETTVEETGIDWNLHNYLFKLKTVFDTFAFLEWQRAESEEMSKEQWSFLLLRSRIERWSSL